MNRTILLTAAAIAVAFAQPVYAHGGGGGGGGHFGGGGGGGHFGGGGGGHFGGFGGGGSHFGGGSVAHFGGGGGARFGGGSPMYFHQAPLAGESAFALRGSPSFQRPIRQVPTVAVGGSTGRNVGRSDFRNFRAPSEVARNWDRRQIHNWNHHRFRFFNNDWFAIDGGYDYPYDYDYGYDSTPYYYDSTPSYYDSAPYADSSAPAQWSVAEPGSLPAAVQRELARRGYHPGEVDGVLGPQTRNAISAFQNDQHLPVTGRIDRSVLSALNL